VGVGMELRVATIPSKIKGGFKEDRLSRHKRNRERLDSLESVKKETKSRGRSVEGKVIENRGA